MIQKTYIHGYTVEYEDSNAEQGAHYLKDDLSQSESQVFFDQAKKNGAAEFEDDNDNQFTLMHVDGTFVVIRR